MMAKTSDELRALLASWSESSPEKPVRAEHARRILSAAGEILKDRDVAPHTVPLLKDYLNITGRPDFLQALNDRAERYRWAESAFTAIERSDYTLVDMLKESVRRVAHKPVFQEMSAGIPRLWSYELVAKRLRAMAAVLYRTNPHPRVAILSENSVESACSDLSCLLYDIYVTPLSVHLDIATLTHICDRLNINIVITDTPEHEHRFEQVLHRVAQPFSIMTLGEEEPDSGGHESLTRAAVELPPEDIEDALENRDRFGIDDECTVMFTSGSTGRPKGVTFTRRNLVTKRFARAAALPEVGENEVLLCYLPLFHTFGRYLEMLGTLYWGGTYVFAGNPSADTLYSLLPRVRPTGMISIPLRWQQLQDRCLERMAEVTSNDIRQSMFREIVGAELRWGLSAAGHLPSHVFRFFNANGVHLCSGFGMTEATGGITMTPPGDYRDESIGIPLPGVRTRLTDAGELQISGPYVARYLPEPDQEDEPSRDYWLSTGDLFRELPDGHFEIVDRIKDIYKNNRGQTVAPRRVERKFEDVPGVKHTFLVGDAREYNVLLIAPDYDDPAICGLKDDEAVREYYHQLITKANQDLAPYERVINFALIERDFDLERGELTPKGSFKRKVVEANFASTIELLYRGKYVELACADLTVRIPRWFYRDLGILEGDISVCAEGLYNRDSECTLTLGLSTTSHAIRIGDLEYQCEGTVVDLGLLAHQPLLWVGNPSLIRFCPCKEGWDLPLGDYSGQVFLPVKEPHEEWTIAPFRLPGVTAPRLLAVNEWICYGLYGTRERAVPAVEQLGTTLETADARIGRVIRRRLEALAFHPAGQLRLLAYRILLLDEPNQDYSKVLPTFVLSGMPFLDDASIQEIAASDLKRRRLEALRRRLFAYRTKLTWPVTEDSRQQFRSLLSLLANFARYHPEYYDTVRSELACWILHHDDPELSQWAEHCLTELYTNYDARFKDSAPKYTEEQWDTWLEFGDELRADERERLKRVLVGTSFLHQSVVLAFDDLSFSLSQIGDKGIWISRIIARRRYVRYRVSINTTAGKHYDLQVILHGDLKRTAALKTIYWLLAISNYPFGPRVLPRLGCCRPELEVRSLAYMGDLTVWEKVREYSGIHLPTSIVPRRNSIRKLFIKGLGAFFRGWDISGRRIVPGAVTPDNVVVAEEDFREGATISSITDWQVYKRPSSLVWPMVHNFFQKTLAHYPYSRQLLDLSWVFDACVEELGLEEGQAFLGELREELKRRPLPSDHEKVQEALEAFIEQLDRHYHIPLPLQNAIDRYNEWNVINPDATPEARGQILGELWRLYRLDRYPPIARYYLYRYTYFALAEDSVVAAFDRLLNRMFREPGASAIQLIELSDLQSELHDPDDRRVFSRLIFPRSRQPQQRELLTIGEDEHRLLIVKTSIKDNLGESYEFRDPIEPVEIGQLYRLFFKEGYHKTVTERDRFLVVVDAQGVIIGGLCYRLGGDDVVHLDGTVIAGPLKRRGIGGALIEDFCSRMANEGIHTIITHFYLRKFYRRHGFRVDRRWGALVRFLDPADRATD